MSAIDKSEKFDRYYFNLLNSTNGIEFRDLLSHMSNHELFQLKDKLDDLYYNYGKQHITDDKYDLLVDFLNGTVEFYKQNIGCTVKDSDNKIQLPHTLNSMNKIKKGDVKKLEKWLIEQPCDSFVISDKLNGVSCLICYSDIGTISLYTRGDGVIGSDISYIKDLIKGVPKGLKSLAVRGELIIEDETFNELYSKDYKNSLGLVVSVVNAKVVKPPIKDIKFVAYEIVTKEAQKSPTENLKQLKIHGFNIVFYTIKKIITDAKLSHHLTRRMEEASYPIDGIIVQTDKPYDRDMIESTGNPKYAFAYKMITDSCETEVVDVIWTASRYSVLKPRIQIKPVELCGATITFATGNNAKFIVDNRINKGSKVLVVRSGEIIPKIEEVLTFSEKPLMPMSKYTWSSTKVDIMMVDGEEEIQDDIDVNVKKISYFFSTLGFKQIADGVVRKLIMAGFDSVFKILNMKVEDFKTIPTFEDKMSNRLYTNIQEKLRDDIDIAMLMVASGFFGQGIGIKKLKTLFAAIPNLLTISDLKEKDICKVDGFSTTTSTKIIQNLNSFKLFLEKFKKLASINEPKQFEYEIVDDDIEENVFTEEEIKAVKSMSQQSQRLKGEVIVFTNFRDAAIQNKLVSLGAEIGESVTKKTTCLVVPNGNSSTTGKVSKANQYGVKILEVSNFVKEYRI
jgi:DNA ligase (NAD+)